MSPLFNPYSIVRRFARGNVRELFTGLKSSTVRHRWRYDVTRKLGERICFQVCQRFTAISGNCRNKKVAMISASDWKTMRNTTRSCGTNRWIESTAVQVQLVLVFLIRQRWRIHSIVSLFGVAAGRRLDLWDGVHGGGTKMATVMTQWWRHCGMKVNAMVSADHTLGVNFTIGWPGNTIRIKAIITIIIVLTNRHCNKKYCMWWHWRAAAKSARESWNHFIRIVHCLTPR